MKKTHRPFGLKCRLRKHTDGRSTIQVVKAEKTMGSFSAQAGVFPDFIVFDKLKKVSMGVFTKEEIAYIKHYFHKHNVERVQPLLHAIEETKNTLSGSLVDKENIEAIKVKFNEMILALEKQAA